MKKILVAMSMLLMLASLACAGELDVKYGPWVTEVGEDSFTVLWITDSPGLAWVELDDGSRFYHEFAGRRIFERLHTVTVYGLEAGKRYGYKIGCSLLKDDSRPKDPVFFPEEESCGYSAKTFDNSAAECRFAVFNDIHCDLKRYRSFSSAVASDSLDFIFLNGDIASAGNYCLDTLAKYDFQALEGCTDHIPVLFARGNHEGRGNNPKLVSDLFPTNTGQFYYAFRQGPVAFVVLDAGETHERRSTAYCGTPTYERYIEEQMVWLKKLAKESWFSDAPLRVCMIHVPMIDIGEEFTLQLWLNKHCVSVLNEAGIDLMISADLHEFQLHHQYSMGNNFPILVNDDDNRVSVTCTQHSCLLDVFDANGQEMYSLEREWK